MDAKLLKMKYNIGSYKTKKEAYDAHVLYASNYFGEFYKPQEYIE